MGGAWTVRWVGPGLLGGCGLDCQMGGAWTVSWVGPGLLGGCDLDCQVGGAWIGVLSYKPNCFVALLCS